ncbi:MAG: hypothetical protein ACPIOQ_71920 [Promethearchaeia archaeon]
MLSTENAQAGGALQLPLPEVKYTGAFYSKLEDVPKDEVRRAFRAGACLCCTVD